MKKTVKSGLAIVSLSFFISAPGFSANAEEIPSALLTSADSQGETTVEKTIDFDIAIGGYDPTDYFNRDTPRLGKPSISYTYDNQKYHFASYDSRDTFASDPERYIPQYAGHCAFAVSQNQLRKADPTAFILDKEKFFLFENQEKLEMWKTNSRKLNLLANKQWEFEVKNLSKAKAKF